MLRSIRTRMGPRIHASERTNDGHACPAGRPHLGHRRSHVPVVPRRQQERTTRDATPELLPPGACGPCCGNDSCQDCCDSDGSCAEETGSPPPTCAELGYAARPCGPGEVIFAATDPDTNVLCCATCATLARISTAFASDGGCPSGSCAALTSFTPEQKCCVPGLQVAPAGVPLCAEPLEITSQDAGWTCVSGCVLDWALPSPPLCCPQGIAPDRGPDGGDASADAGVDAGVEVLDASADVSGDVLSSDAVSE